MDRRIGVTPSRSPNEHPGIQYARSRQAIAIALHEAGASNQESPADNDRTLARTKAKERSGRTAELLKPYGLPSAACQKP